MTTNASINPITGVRARWNGRRRGLRTDPGRFAAYVFLIVMAIIYIAPMAMLVLTSLKTLPEFNKNAVGLPATLALDNFAEAWDKANFPRYLLNTVIYTASSAIIFVITGTFLAVAIARRFVRGSGAMFTLFLIALFLPPALIPQFQLILNLGLYNNPIGYILLFLVNPIGIVILVNYIRTIPIELDEAAAIEGCGYLRYVIQIVLPLAKPAIATVAVLHSIGVWNELVLATIYLTNSDYYPITRGLIVFNGVYGNNWPVLAAAVLMIAAPMAIFFVFMQRYIIGGVTAGAVKG
ncbi:MAG: carbohydrate ABC transporter permease [Candidatus Limnocylindria bacterium]